MNTSSQTYKCMVVDDEELARELIESHIAKLPNFELVASCASAVEASAVIKDLEVDLLFLDIQMPVLKGNEFYKSLSNKPRAIFTTAYRDYAIEGFELDVVDYLLKPIVFSRFFQAVEKFLALNTDTRAQQESGPMSHIFIRVDRKNIKVVFDDILYIKGLKDYVQIICEDKTYTTKSTLSNMLKQLDSQFCRIHRSYIVNTKHVSAFTQHDVEIGEIEIPIGEKYANTLLSKQL